MSYTLAGRLQLPGNATPAAGVDIVFRAATTLSPLIQTAQTRIRTSADGSYTIDLPSGTYTVEVTFADNVPFNAGTIIIHSQLVAGLDLPTLLGGGFEPTTPEWIQQIHTWMETASTAATTATAKATEAGTSATNAKASETAAAASKTAAAASQTAAKTSETNSKTSETNADASELAAKNSQDSATASALLATTQATQSKNSATASAASATLADSDRVASAASAVLAQAWAANPVSTDIPGSVGQFSSMHWALQAQQYAQAISSALVWKGGWSAAAGTSPPAPAANTGVPFYRISAAGTIATIVYAVGDYIHWDTSTSNWFKIDGTDAVVSVNGKTGAATINAADVQAVALTGDSNINGVITTNGLVVNKTGESYSGSFINVAGTICLQGGKTDKSAADQKMAITGFSDTPLSLLTVKMTQAVNPKIQWGANTYDLFHVGKPPTAAQCGAVALGGTRTDALSHFGDYDSGSSGNVNFGLLEAGTNGLFSTGTSLDAPGPETRGSGLIGLEVQKTYGGKDLVQTTVPFRTAKTTAFRTRDQNGSWGAGWISYFTTAFPPKVTDITGLVGDVSNGAIIEEGSNASGTFVKFMNGTVICNMAGKLPATALSANITLDLSLPCAVTSGNVLWSCTPPVSGSLEAVGAVYSNGIAAFVNVTKASLRGYTYVRAIAESVPVTVTVIGRWK